MASSIGLKIGIDGESEFRKAIGQINDSFKTLKSEMNTVTSAFDKNDKSQEKLTKQSEVLAKQIELQKKKIEECNAALDKATAKYGENDRVTQSWKRTVNDATADLNKLERQLKETNATIETQDNRWLQLSGSMDNVKSKFQAIGDKLTSIGKTMAIGVTLPVVAAGTAMVNLASDYNESLNKVGVAFGGSADDVVAWSETTLDSFGIAGGTALDMAALFGDMGTSMGIPQDEAANMSMSMTGLAGDLASFKNIGIDQAMTALNGVFTGETESLKTIGIVMTEANLDAYALANGFGKTTNEMTQAEKVMLRYAYVMDSTKNSQGDFTNTSDGTANSIRVFQESLKELGAEFGQKLLPVITPIIQNLTDMIKGFGDLDDGTQKLILGFGGIAAVAGPLLIFFGAIASGIGSIAGLIGTLSGSMAVATAGTAGATAGAGGLAAAFTALTGPIGIAIAAIAAIGAVIAGAWQNSEVFRESVGTAFETVKTTATEAMAKLSEAMGPAMQAFQGFAVNVSPILKEIGDFLGMYVIPLITQFVIAFINGFTAIVAALAPFIAAIGNLFSFIGNFVGMVFALLTGDWSTAWTFAQNMGKNACDFIENIFQGLSNWVNLIFTGISTFLMGIWRGIYDNTIGKVIEMATTVATHFEEIRVGAQTKFEEIKQNIITAVQELPGKLYQTAKDMLGKMVKGIQETASNVYDAVTGLVGDVMKKFKEGFGIASPSKELFNIGKFMIQGLINGLNGDSLMAFVNSMVEEIKAKFAGGSFNLKAAIDFVGSGALEFFKSIGIGGASFGGLTAPVSGGVTSGFGNRDSFMTDSGEMSSKWHEGIDIGAAYGTAVGAAGAGTVTTAGWYGGYGNTVILDHGNGLQTLYGHLSEILVSVGQLVTQLQTIGLVGSTGNSTGPHLHFGVYQDGVAIDPSSLFGFDVGSRYIPRDMVAMIHQGEMIVPKSENPYANSGGAVLPQMTAQKQPAVINLVLQNGSKLAEYLIDDINNMLGVKTGLAGRGMA